MWKKWHLVLYSTCVVGTSELYGHFLILNPFLKRKGTQHTLVWWLWNLTDCLILSQWQNWHNKARVNSFLFMSNQQQQWVKIVRVWSLIPSKEKTWPHTVLYRGTSGEGGRGEIKEKKATLVSLYCDSLSVSGILGSTFPFPILYHACNFYFMSIREGHQICHIIKENSSSIMICTGSKVTMDGKI